MLLGDLHFTFTTEFGAIYLALSALAAAVEWVRRGQAAPR
jgi:hypothetical protein